MAGAFDEAATSESVSYLVSHRPVQIVIRENPDENGAPVTIKVTFEVEDMKGGRHETLEVPQDTVDNNWPGPEKTLEDYCLTLIGLAE